MTSIYLRRLLPHTHTIKCEDLDIIKFILATGVGVALRVNVNFSATKRARFFLTVARFVALSWVRWRQWEMSYISHHIYRLHRKVVVERLDKQQLLLLSFSVLLIFSCHCPLPDVSPYLLPFRVSYIYLGFPVVIMI